MEEKRGGAGIHKVVVEGGGGGGSAEEMFFKVWSKALGKNQECEMALWGCRDPGPCSSFLSWSSVSKISSSVAAAERFKKQNKKQTIIVFVIPCQLRKYSLPTNFEAAG